MRRECAWASIIRGIHNCIRCGFPSVDTMTLFGVRPPQPGFILASETSGLSVRISGLLELQKLYLDQERCSLGKQAQ